MSRNIFNPEELRRFAARLKQFNNEMISQLTTLHGQLAGLIQTWRDPNMISSSSSSSRQGDVFYATSSNASMISSSRSSSRAGGGAAGVRCLRCLWPRYWRRF